MRQGKEQIEAKTKVPITEVRVSGGGSQSDMAMQITADVFGLPVQRPATIETSGLGAAICCAVGLGWYSSFSAALAAMTQTGQTFYPNAENHQLYQRLYHQVYKKCIGVYSLYIAVLPKLPVIRSNTKPVKKTVSPTVKIGSLYKAHPGWGRLFGE